jgi:hypothetical protein
MSGVTSLMRPTITSPISRPQELIYYCGGQNRGDLVNTQRRLWLSAASLNPHYAVLHVSHIELPHAFTREYTYTNAEVIDAVADMLNTTAATFPAGEPPVRLYLENLWWPGLTLTQPEMALRLASRLTFENWAIVLDTGHLMNNNHTLTTQEEGIDFTLQTLSILPRQITERIEGLHFHYSLSGQYQQEKTEAGLPAGFSEMDALSQRGMAGANAYQIDQHNPFSSPRCGEIVDALTGLRFLTHEFLTATQDEYNSKLTTQQAALHNVGGS